MLCCAHDYTTVENLVQGNFREDFICVGKSAKIYAGGSFGMEEK